MEDLSLPVACSLTDSELQERRRDVLQKVRGAASDAEEIEGGFAYHFSSGESLITELADLVKFEHKCCPFLKFRITVEPGDGPVHLEITGPQGTKEFLSEIFN